MEEFLLNIYPLVTVVRKWIHTNLLLIKSQMCNLVLMLCGMHLNMLHFYALNISVLACIHEVVCVYGGIISIN